MNDSEKSVGQKILGIQTLQFHVTYPTRYFNWKKSKCFCGNESKNRCTECDKFSCDECGYFCDRCVFWVHWDCLHEGCDECEECDEKSMIGCLECLDDYCSNCYKKHICTT